MKYIYFQMLDNYRNKLVIQDGKRFCEKFKQKYSSQNESDSRNHKSFITKRTEKGNYETISFEKASKYIQKYIQN